MIDLHEVFPGEPFFGLSAEALRSRLRPVVFERRVDETDDECTGAQCLRAPATLA